VAETNSTTQKKPVA